MWLVEQQNPPLHPHTAPDMNASAYVAHAPSLIEACDVNGAGRGYFLKNGAGVPAGTALLHCKAPVSVLNDAHESKNCRNCLQPIDHDESRTATVEYMTATTASSSDSGNRALPSTTAGPREFVCTGCRRSAICSSCYNVNSHEEAGTIAAPNNSAPDTLHSHGSSPHNGGGGDSITTVAHSVLECEALANLSRLQLAQPHLASSLLGSSTVYLRLLLQLLALRATTPRQSRRARRNEPEAARVARERLNAIEELEDHLDDLLDAAELEARVSNTIAAAKLVAPAAWKASQDECASFLGKLYCNSMTIGKPGVSASLARRGYWSKIRGCLYSDFGVGLFPPGALFNHSCAPNCAWRTDELGMLRVVTVRDVCPGEQLCISYVDILQPGPVRRELLREHYFFECTCSRCSIMPRQHARHDEDDVGDDAEGHGDGDEINEEDLVTGGWVCPKRSCCGRGRVLRRAGSDCIEQVDDSSDLDMEQDQQLALPASLNREHGALNRSGGACCRTCGGFTEEAYFCRWEGVLGGRLAAADERFSNRRVREGRRKLEELQALCERRLAATHAFTLGVLSRLVVGAAADRDWPAVVSLSRRTLACMQGIRDGISSAHASRGEGDGAGAVAAAVVARGNARGGRSTAASFADAGISVGTRGVTGTEGLPMLAAAAIWEAVIVETLERALPLANALPRTLLSGGDSTGIGVDSRRLHASRLVTAERATAVLGLRRAALVHL